MSRLTTRNEYMQALCADNGTKECLDINDCILCKRYKDMLYKLSHYEDLEEQGRLIVQKHGHWIRTGLISCKCSECNYLPIESYTPYCPHCGAKMDEVEK